MAPYTGFNRPGAGNILGIKRVIASIYVKLVQANNCK